MEDYFNKAIDNRKIPMIPVIHKDIVILYFNDDLREKFEKFINLNPKSDYIMLDGNHRTTALTLSQNLLGAIVLENDEDFRRAKEMVRIGELLESDIYDEDLESNCKILQRHFSETFYFETVLQKTLRLVRDKLVEQSLIDYFLINAKF
jgi:hypothetical protein